MKLTAKHIEYAVAKSIDYRQNNIVPNISWGAGLHECDLLVVKRSKWATEIEIKISKSDLKADLKKKHCHESEKIQELYYALPEEIYEQCKEIIPEHAGIITVSGSLSARLVRSAKKNPNARKLTDEEVANILRLGNMRTWSMRKRNLENEGIIAKPKRETKHERRVKDLEMELSNLRYFLKRARFNNPEMVQEEIEKIERIIEK